jgi:hypothetical protein
MQKAAAGFATETAKSAAQTNASERTERRNGFPLFEYDCAVTGGRD